MDGRVKLVASRVPMSPEALEQMRTMSEALDMPLREVAKCLDRALHEAVTEPLATSGPRD